MDTFVIGSNPISSFADPARQVIRTLSDTVYLVLHCAVLTVLSIPKNNQSEKKSYPAY